MNEMIVFDTKHTKSINDCVLDYYAKRLATCSSDNSVKVFDVSSLNSSVCVAEMRDHTSAVWRVCWSHPKYGGLLASCSYDRSIIVYKEIEANKYGKIYINTEHKGSINSIEWAPYELGLHLGCASSDGYISIISYNLNKDNNTEGCWHRYYVKAHLNGVSCISWEKKSTAFMEEKNMSDSADQFNSFKLVSGGFDNQVIIWIFDNNSKEFHKIFQMRDEPHKSAVRDVAWKPNTRNSLNIIASCSDQQVILWEEDVNANVWVNKQTIDMQHKIDRIAWSPNGTILAISCDDENIFLYKENEEGVWINLHNLGSSEVDIPSNSVTSAFKDYAPQGFTNTLNDVASVDREVENHHVYNESYQQTSAYGLQAMDANYMNMQNKNLSINTDTTKYLRNAQHLQSQSQSQSHMQVHTMDPTMNVSFTQQGMSNVMERSRDPMLSKSGMDLNRNVTNSESLNMPNKYQANMHMDANKNKASNASLTNQNALSPEQYRVNNFADISSPTNNMMDHSFKNTLVHQPGNMSIPPISPPSRSNKYELGKTHSIMNQVGSNPPLPPTSAVSNTHMDNSLSRSDVPPQQMHTPNMNYPSMRPSSTFAPQQISPPGPPPSAVTNPNVNTPSSVPQQPENFTNRSGMNVASSVSAFSPTPDPSFTSPINAPPSLRMQAQNLNATRKNVEQSLSSSSLAVPPPVGATSKPPPSFANMHTGMNTGHMVSTSSISGQVVPPSTYIPPPANPHPPPMSSPINTGPSHFPPFNQNVNKGMTSPLNISSNDVAGGRSGMEVPTGMPSAKNALSSTSNLMGPSKPILCPPPPPPPPASSSSSVFPPPPAASHSLQSGGSNVLYGRSKMPNHMAVTGNTKSYMNPNEYINTNENPPLNRPMN